MRKAFDKPYILTLLFVLFSLAANANENANALGVRHLSVNTLQNPSGIDSLPLLGWEITSDLRSVVQESYEITVANDSLFSEVVWQSGEIESSKSFNVLPQGLSLAPSHRYFWRVAVKDNRGNSVLSNELAYFDTGVMNDWEGAMRIRSGNFDYFTKKPFRQTIQMDITHIAGSPSVMFGATEENNGFEWQLVLNNDTIPVLKRSKRQYSTIVDLGEVELPQFLSGDLLEKEFSVTLDITDGFIINTYINDCKVDSFRSDVGLVYVEKFGVCDRSTPRGQIFLDNVKCFITPPDGSPIVTVYEDFEKPISLFFPDADIEDGPSGRKAHLKGRGSGYAMLYLKSAVPVFCRSFGLQKQVKSAFIHASAHGVFDMYINGRRVGYSNPDGTMKFDELKPGWTDFPTKSHYFTYEVSPLLIDGNNILGAVVSPGWTLGSISKNRYTAEGIPFVSFICKLVINYTDGTSETIVSDEQWQTSRFAPLITGEIYEGEYFDANYKWPWEKGCDMPSFNVLTTDHDSRLEPFPGYGISALDSIAPTSITIYDGIIPYNDYGAINVVDVVYGNAPVCLKRGQTAIYDFGQNLSGVPYFRVKGEKGTRLQMRFGEILNDSGSEERYNDGPKGSLFRRNMRSESIARLFYVTSASDSVSEVYRPSSTYYGYRYVEVSASDDIEMEVLYSIPLSSSYADEGQIVTDNTDVNKLFDAVMWSQRSNLVGIPTDCPSRNERLGWSGDAQIFAPTALYNANVSEMLRKWLGDMRDCQRSDGAYPDIAPQCLNAYGNGAWADAGVIVTWHLYLATGNVDILLENYDAMSRYMDYLDGLSADSQDFCGGGIAYGDWLAVTETDSRFVSQALYAFDALLMAKMASALCQADSRYADDVEKYDSLFSAIRDEMQKSYFHRGGLIHPTQTACALALSYRLYESESQRKAISLQLKSLLSDSSFTLDTGFVGTQYLLPSLSDSGFNDLAYKLLLQRQYPSWLYCLDNGATTLWERWDAYRDDVGIFQYFINSFNHYALGSVVEWMYRYMAGVSSSEDAPGFKKSVFRPFPYLRSADSNFSDYIGSVNASTHTPYGAISAGWSICADGSYDYHIIVPPNTDATIDLPKMFKNCVVLENDSPLEFAEGISNIVDTSDRIVFSAASGEYNFSVTKTLSDIDLSSDIVTRCYPNPTSRYINLVADAPVESAYLVSPSGAVMREWPAESFLPPSVSLDLSGVSPGIYMLLIVTPQGTDTRRIVKTSR